MPSISDEPGGRVRHAILAKDREHRARREALTQAASNEPRLRNDLLPPLELVERPLLALIAPKRNVRAHDPAHVREVANAISLLSECVPLLIDGAGHVIDGLVRLEAAKLLGLPKSVASSSII